MTMAATNVDGDYASPKSSPRFVQPADDVIENSPVSPKIEETEMNSRSAQSGDGTKETKITEESDEKSLTVTDGEGKIDTQWRRIAVRTEGYLSDRTSSVDSLVTPVSEIHQQVVTATNRTPAFDNSFNDKTTYCNQDSSSIKKVKETKDDDCCKKSWRNGTDMGFPLSRINGRNDGNISIDAADFSSNSSTETSIQLENRRRESFGILPSLCLRDSSKPTARRMSLGIVSFAGEKQYTGFTETTDRKTRDGKGKSAGDSLSPPTGRKPMNQGAARKRLEKQERSTSPLRERKIKRNSVKNVLSSPTAVDRINCSPRITVSSKPCSCSRGRGERDQDETDVTENSSNLDKDSRQVRQKPRETEDTSTVLRDKLDAKNRRSPRRSAGSPSCGGEDHFPRRKELSPRTKDKNLENRLTDQMCEDCGKPRSLYDRYPYLHEYSEYLNREAGTYGENDVSKFKGNRRMDSRVETPVASLLYRSRSLPRLSVHDSGVASGNENTQVPDQPQNPKQLVADFRQLLTLKQHYYPEGGWGWVILVVGILVQILSHGTQGAIGVLLQHVTTKFGSQVHLQAGWLGAMSTGVALLVSPVTIAFCRRKSTRVTAVMGGLVAALGCLFTSFASQFHQLFFSYGTVVGIGVGMTRDCSTLMVAQYFKRRRELVEIFIVSGSGLGIAVMSAFIKGAISKIGWRLGLQAVTGVVFLTFILGTFYRSASLYHPQRRAILHLKNQKRKIKDKNKGDDRPPFFDFSTLRSKTVRILLVSTGISAFGINTPIFYLAHQAEEEGLGDTVVLLQAYLGLAWTLGCVAFGLLVVHRNVECRIARQYLTQAAVFVCGLCILALTAVQGNYHGYVMFAWIYGIFCGGYQYSLKMYTYERVRARNFARTWGFVQCSQAIPIAIGVPISGYMNVGCGGKAGYYFSSTCVLVGSFTLFFIDLHKRNVLRHKHTRANGTKHLCVSDNCPQRRRLSFSQEPDIDGGHPPAPGAATTALVVGTELAPPPGETIDALGVDKPELTCISEEGIADMDLPDNLLEDLDYIGDCITSCNKVENYLMLSEFENNLIAEMPIIMDRRGRRWSLAKSKPGPTCGSQSTGNGGNSGVPTNGEDEETKSKYRLTNAPPNNRMITVIHEANA